MSDEKNYFDDIQEFQKRDVAFNILVAVRDAISLAQKKSIPPTYESALRITHDLNEDLYNFCSSQLTKKNENDTVKLFKERAEAETLKQGKPITASDLLKVDIKEYRDLLTTPNLDKDKTKFLKTHIAGLETALENIKPRRLSEHRILERDFCKIDREHLGAEKFFESDNYVDYKLKNDKFLRLRLLHPDKAEHIIGADLIYEQYDVQTEKVRIAVLQYKTWEDGVLYFSQAGNLEAQMGKLKANLCDKKFCEQPKGLQGKLDYRFPYCCAFLRPTDKMQNPDSKMISHGIHIPICSALQIKLDNENKIEKSQIRHSTLTHEVFETLFNHSFIGSRWKPINELQEFYQQRKILEPDQSIKLYAKEIICSKI